MSRFVDAETNFEETNVVSLADRNNGVVIYSSRPIFIVDQRFIKNPVIAEHIKDCECYAALPIFNWFKLLREYTETFVKLMKYFEPYLPPTNIPSRFKEATQLAIHNSRLICIAPITMFWPPTEMAHIAVSVVMYSILLALIHIFGSFESDFIYALHNSNNAPIDTTWWSTQFFLSILYQISLIYSRFKDVKPTSDTQSYYNMHDQVLLYENDEHAAVVQVNERNGNEGQEEEEENVENIEEANESEEEELVDVQDQRNVQDPNSTDEDSESVESFIEVERDETNNKDSERDDEVDEENEKIEEIRKAKEALGTDLSVNQSDKYILLENQYSLKVNQNVFPVCVFQWPVDKSTTRSLALFASHMIIHQLFGLFLHCCLMPLGLTFIARLFFSTLMQSMLFQWPFHLLYLATEDFWLTKAIFILSTQIVQNYLAKKANKKPFTLQYVLSLITKNTIRSYIMTFFVPSYPNWSIIDTMHCNWILSFFWL